MEYGGNEVVGDIAAMKIILEVEAPFTDKSQVNKMGAIYPIAIFRIENVWPLVRKGQFVEELAILSMALFVNAFRLKSISPDSQSGTENRLAGIQKLNIFRNRPCYDRAQKGDSHEQ
jgi:hypothetical protein